MSVEPIHSLGAVLRGALLLVLFTLGVEIYAQSYNMSESYRIGGTTQTTPSVMQGGYGGMSNGYQVSDNGYKLPDTRSRETGRFTTYQSTVYEPFTAAAPSDNHPINDSQITGRRNAWGGGGMGDQEGDDPGHIDPNSPVGEPFVLLLFAAVAAMVVAWRKKEPTPALPEGKE